MDENVNVTNKIHLTPKKRSKFADMGLMSPLI